MKPTKEQLSKLSSHCMVHCDSAGWTMVRAEDLRALLDDYRARGEVLRKLDESLAWYGSTTTWRRRIKEALEGAGDEP